MVQILAGDIQHSVLIRRPLDRSFKLFKAEDRYAWIITIIIFLVLLAFDHLVIFRKPWRMSFGVALCYNLFWVSCALFFCIGVGCWKGPQFSYMWANGYTLQWMMSFDNLFVFHLIFKVYGTPDALKHRPLFLGILGAIVFTLTGLTCGEYIFHTLYVLHIFFGLFFIYTGVMQAMIDDEDNDPTQNPIVQWLQANMPFESIYDTEGNFFVRLPVNDDGSADIPRHAYVEEAEGVGKRHMPWLVPDTPGKSAEESHAMVPMVDLSSLDLESKKTEVRATLLFLVLCTIEISDVLFSMDTIVAISSQIGDLFIAFTCVAFALLTLRATFFIVEVLAQMFSLMKYGIAAILAYIGIKLVIDRWVLVPHIVDCIVLIGTFGGSIVGSAIYDDTHIEDSEGGTAEQLLRNAPHTAA